MAMPTRPSAATRPDFLAAAERPFLRGLGERFFAVHHAGAGGFAQVFDHRRCNVSHLVCPSNR
jgi:hypothetical protein